MYKTWLYDFHEMGDLDFVENWKYDKEEKSFEINGRWRYKGVYFPVSIWGKTKNFLKEINNVEDILEAEWDDYFIDIGDNLDEIYFDDYLLKEIEEYEKGKEIDEDDSLMLIFEHAKSDGWYDLCPILLKKLERDFPNTYKKVKKILDKWEEKD